MATATLNDMATLTTDTTLQGRIFMSLMVYCTVTVPGEAVASSAGACSTHIARKNFAAQVMNNPNNYKTLFVNAVCANQIVANDATTNGTIVGDAPATLATAALLCTDTDINNAVAAAFNAFVGSV